MVIWHECLPFTYYNFYRPVERQTCNNMEIRKIKYGCCGYCIATDVGAIRISYWMCKKVDTSFFLTFFIVLMRSILLFVAYKLSSYISQGHFIRKQSMTCHSFLPRFKKIGMQVY